MGANFVKTMLRLLQEREQISVVDDQRGTPTSAVSLADVLWRFSRQPALAGVFHWSGGGEASWYEFALKIQQLALERGLLDRKIPIHPIASAAYPTPARRPRYSVLDTSATCAALKVAPGRWEDELEIVMDVLGAPECKTSS